MFEPAKLNRPPNQSELHYWVDYVELLCVSDADGHFSAERLSTWAGFADDFEATSQDSQDGDYSDVTDSLLDIPLDEDGFDFIEDVSENPPEEGIGYDDFGRAAEMQDDRLAWCQQIFGLMADRQKSLGPAYPFTVDASGLQVERNEELGDEARIYLFMLSCSLLRYVSQSTMQTLTAIFEAVSLRTMRALLPPTAVVDAYGTARGLVESRFSGSQFQRLTALAGELRGRVLIDEREFHPRDSGDNGLDLVGWIPFPDQAPGVLAFFAQCACGARWDGKQYEAGHERWREYLHLKSPQSKITLIPYYFRRPGEQWYSPGDVSGILIDRLRAVRCLSETAIEMPALDTLIVAAWEFRLSTV